MDVKGEPPGKVHNHEEGVPVDKSVNCTLPVAQTKVGTPLKLATGASPAEQVPRHPRPGR